MAEVGKGTEDREGRKETMDALGIAESLSEFVNQRQAIGCRFQLACSQLLCDVSVTRGAVSWRPARKVVSATLATLLAGRATQI